MPLRRNMLALRGKRSLRNFEVEVVGGRSLGWMRRTAFLLVPDCLVLDLGWLWLVDGPVAC